MQIHPTAHRKPIDGDTDLQTNGVEGDLDRSAAELIATAEAGDLRGCDDAWDDFVHHVERRLAIEEAVLMPLAESRRSPAIDLLARLLEGGVSIRREADELGLLLQVRAVPPAEIIRFAECVRMRARQERDCLRELVRSGGGAGARLRQG